MASYVLDEYYEVQLFDEVYGEQSSVTEVKIKLHKAASKRVMIGLLIQVKLI